MSKRRFHSCFVVDVSFNDKEVVLTDSTRARYSISTSNKEVLEQLKSWMTDVFLRGVPQQLTVFEYEDVGEGPDIDNRIIKFCNLPQKTEKQING